MKMRITTMMNRRRTHGTRLAIFSVSASLIATSLVTATASAASPVVTDPTAEVPAKIESAAWLRHSAKLGGGLGANSVVSIAPRGTGIWGTVITAGAQEIPAGATVVISGLPAGVAVTSAGLPTSVDAADAASLSCSPLPVGASCVLDKPIASGKSVTAALALRDTTGLGDGGSFDGTAQLVGSGIADNIATPIRLDVKQGTKDKLFWFAEGEPVVTAGQVHKRTLHAYNLGGGVAKKAKVAVSVSSIAPPKFAQNLKVSGKRWNCDSSGRGTCRWQGKKVLAGTSLNQLSVRFAVPANAVRKLSKKQDIRRLAWQATIKADRIVASSKFPQKLSIAPVAPVDKKKKNPSKYIRVPQLTIAPTVHTAPRLGGTGRFQLTTHNGGGKAARGVKVQIKTPAHARVTPVRSKGWSCDTASTCRYRGAIKAHSASTRVSFKIKSTAKHNRLRTSKIKAVATWNRVKGATKNRTHTKRVVVKKWEPIIKVKARAQTEGIASEMGGKGVLAATVDGMNGKPYIYRWQQLCEGKAKCPKVKWEAPTSTTAKSRDLSISFTATKRVVKKPLQFQLTVKAGGVVIRKRVTARIQNVDVKELKYKPITDMSQLKRKQLPPRLDYAKAGGAYIRPVAKAKISTVGSKVARPGKILKLKASVKMLRKKKTNQVRSIKWSIRGANGKIKNKKSINRGSQFRFRVPAGQLSPLVVTMKALHRGKVVTTASRLFGGADFIGLNRSLGFQAQSDTFCSIFAAAQDSSLPSVQFDNLTMTMGTVGVVGDSCSAPNAEVTFSGAQLTVNGIGLTNLTGDISAARLAVYSGVAALPSGTGIPGQLTDFTLVNAPTNPFLTVAFSGGGLAGLNATLNLPSLPYLPLPVGWGLTSAKVTIAGSSVSLTATAAGRESDTLSLSGTINPDSSFTLAVTAANLWPQTSSTGSTLVYSGTGAITRTAAGVVTYAVNITSATSDHQPFQIYGGVVLQNASLTWNAQGITVNGNLSLALGGTTYVATINGVITDFHNWTITATYDHTITMEWLGITNPTGTISGVRNPTTGITKLSMQLTASASLQKVDPDFQVQANLISANIGIFCSTPVLKATPACQKNQLQLQVDIVGTITYQFDESHPIPVDTTVEANTVTGAFTIDIGIGTLPDLGLNMGFTSVNLFYSNDPQNDPYLANNPCLTDAELSQEKVVEGFTATGTFEDSGWTGNIVALIHHGGDGGAGGGGLCIYGSAQTGAPVISPTEVPTDAGSFASGLSFVFTQYKTVLNLQPQNPDGPLTTINSYVLAVVGQYALPSDLASMIDIGAVDVIMTKKIGGGGFAAWSITLQVDLDNAYIIGSAGSSTSLQVVSAGLVVARGAPVSVQPAGPPNKQGKLPPKIWEPGALTLGLTVQVNLHLPGGTSTDPNQVPISGSVIPMTGMIAKGFTGAGAGTITASLTLGDAGENYSFGLSGLQVEAFTVQGVISPNPLFNSLGIAATVQTPQQGEGGGTLASIVEFLGVQPGVPISFALQISEESPCYALTIGNPTGNQLAISAFGGIVEADYFEFYWAPMGCAVTTGIANLPNFGYAADFDGALLGVPVTFNAVYSVSHDGIDIQLDIVVNSFGIAGIDVTKPNVHLAIDGVATEASLTLSGKINLWGLFEVEVAGNVGINFGSYNPEVHVMLQGSEDMSLFGIFDENAAFGIDAGIQWPEEGGAAQIMTLDVAATTGFNYQVISTSATVAFDYSEGAVNSMYASFAAGVDFYIVSGGATVSLSFCNVAQTNTCALADGQTIQGTNGDLNINVSGYLKFWLFGWQTLNVTILDTSIPIAFAAPANQAPAPVNYPKPAPPISQWPSGNWDYQSQMYMGINWTPAELAAAAGLPASTVTNGQLAYGMAPTDDSLGTPTVRFYQAETTLGTGSTTTTGASTSVTASVTLPETPTYKLVTSGHVPPAKLKQFLPAISECSGGATKTISIQVPKWQDGHPISTSSAALIVATVNWWMYLSSVIETTSINGYTDPLQMLENYQCGYGMITGATPDNPGGTSVTNPWTNFPSAQNWFDTNSQAVQLNLAYPQAYPNGGDPLQFCTNPATAQYQQACQTNIAAMNGAWGTGWGVGSTSGG